MKVCTKPCHTDSKLMKRGENEFFLTDFYKYTDTPITCYLLPFVPKNVNTLSDLQQLNMQDNL